MWMKKTILIALFLCLAGSMTSFADVIVYEDNYNDETVGAGFTEGSAWNWGDGATTHTAVYADYGGNIVVEHTGTIDNSTGTAAADCRFGSKWDITLSGNTRSDPAVYTISFDVNSVSGNWDPIDLEFFVLTGGDNGVGYGSGASAYAQADGWVHVEANLADLTVGWWNGTNWDLTSNPWSIEVGGPPWPGTSVPAGTPAWDQVWIMDNLKITMIPEPAVLAKNPFPEDGEPDARCDVVLSWTPGDYVGGLSPMHKIFFSEDFNNVNEGTATSVEQDANSYDPPGLLDFDTTCYWRVDEANSTTGWDQGDVWSFTTADYLVVDDMEFYGDSNVPGEEGSRVFYVWRDGFTVTNPYNIPGNGTASQVGHDIWALVSPYDHIMETTIVNSGSQSMPFYYFNDGTHSENPNVCFSEITAQTSDLPIGNNWTQAGVKALTLWFYGDPENDANDTEQMYVKLNGEKINYDGDMNDIREASWHEWKIELAAFGIDPNNVTEIAIGFGDENNTTPGGKGMVYFDDIRLYPCRCIFSERTADFAKADYAPTGYPAGNCVIDYQELEIMMGDWLAEDDIITTTVPGPMGLLDAYYPLDEGTDTTTADASGNNFNGTFEGGVTWITPGLVGNSAINVDGTPGTRISLTSWNPAGLTGQLTLSAWIRWSGVQTDSYSQGLISKRGGWDAETVYFMFEITGYGDNMLALRQYGDANTDVASAGGVLVPFIGKWAHVAVTFDGVTARIYLNGEEIASGPFFFGGGSDATITIGNTNSPEAWLDCPETFSGDMDEVRIYSRALTAGEIAYLADLTPGDGQLHVPVPSPAELYDTEPEGSRKIDLKDFAILTNFWLEEQLWP
jgi:hypothetical protein